MYVILIFTSLKTMGARGNLEQEKFEESHALSKSVEKLNNFFKIVGR